MPIAVIIGLILSFVFKDKYPHIYVSEKMEVMFDKELNNADVIAQQIKLTNKAGEQVPVELKLYDYNESIVLIEPPQGGYKAREIYTLRIDSSLNYTLEGKEKNIKEFTFRAVKNEKLNIKDKNLEKAIRNQISKPEGDLYIGDVQKIKMLNAQYYGILDLSGIKKLKELEALYLDGNAIDDVSELKYLANLEVLSLTDNKLTKIDSLGKLTKLNTLWLNGNSINDFKPLKESYENLTQKDFHIE